MATYYSKKAYRDYTEPLLTYDVDTFIDQLEDILRYVLYEAKEKCVPIGGLLIDGLLSIKAVALIANKELFLSATHTSIK